MKPLKKSHLFLFTSTVILSTCSFTARATNGYFAHGYGARSKALAGADVAFSQDAIAAALNPAGLVYVGNRLDIEAEIFSPQREYRVSGAGMLQPGTHTSTTNFFAIPTLGWSYKLDNAQSIGVALYGNGGMNTDYLGVVNTAPSPFAGSKGVFGGGRTGIDMAQAFLSTTYARAFDNGRYALGIAPIFALQYFKAEGLGAFANSSIDASHLSNTGRDYSVGIGFKVGGQAELLLGVRLGIAYKSRTYMSKFDNYAGLFADQGSFDIPSSLDTGLSWAVNSEVTTAFDVQQIFYSEINSVGNALQPLALGAGNGSGFGWRDMTIYKFGTQWKANDHWTWRGGVSYGQQPIPGSQVLFNILAPGVQEWHLTGGLTHTLSNKDQLSFAFMYSPQKTITGPNPLSAGQSIDLSMEQFSLQFGWSHSF